jgi:Putative polyhydroxyalkanoic acid system protein (PHA_gran_rgn)
VPVKWIFCEGKAGLHPALFFEAVEFLPFGLSQNAYESPFSARASSPHAGQDQGDTAAMSEPLIVVIPHRLGKDEALRRIRDGIGRAKTEFAWLLSLDEEAWTGDRLTFRVSALGQHASGIIDVYEAGVRLEVTLPWLLARFAHAAQRVIGQRGHLMLEKK